jgi:peptidoglycan hydrolase CwlO-like protein
MTMRVDPNPFNWSADIKALAQLIMLIGTISGWAIYLGDKVYQFAEAQTHMIEQIKTVHAQIVEQKAEIQDTNRQREVSIAELRGNLDPRIAALEQAVHTAETEAAAAKMRADDMKEDLKQLKDLAVRNLNVTESHGADIKATREAVAPKEGPPLP